MNDRRSYLPLKRPRIETGQIPGANEMSADQRYFREVQRRHNRLLHGWGIVAGLEVDIERDAVIVSAGMALDCAGNEIMVPAAVRLGLPPCVECIYVYASYSENEHPAAPTRADNELSLTFFEEGYLIGYEMENRLMVHARAADRWQTCGLPHPIPLARLRNLKKVWKIDRRYFKPPRAY
jgi:hypothetical protein